ncbi:hypothetical protein BMW22_17660 [Rhizobium leguminosarum]|uniref:AprE-like beta-barrel domain-containing protein n=1 Tax=Rhizobium leguminosarum TaxID=384 RepID=A0A1L3ZC18_RHILE|nr:HlyD family secretion protein [Rhizobium leguminosarum]API53194.1 hypothetical protein BMW22_17660 [Rhizobium leguminosarum]
MKKDIGFMTVGQDAVVKLKAFPFTRYGTITAHVTKIAADAILEPDAGTPETTPRHNSRRRRSAAPKQCGPLAFPISPSLRLNKFQHMTVTSI